MIDWGNARPLNEEAVIWTRDAGSWPTPVVTDANGARNETSGRSNPDSKHHSGVTLNDAIRKWPTPQAREGDNRGSDPSRRDQAGRHGGWNLPDWAADASLWRTPSVAISAGGQSSRSGDRKGEELLAGQARTVVSDLRARSLKAYTGRNTWPTATATNRPRSDETLAKCLTYREAKAGQTTVPLYLEEVATSLFHHLDPATSTPGEPSSPSDPNSPPLSLNPLFVAWLMNWVVPASTNSGLAEMGSSLWRARMRSALSQLGSPPAAPPAQLSLFG